MVHVKIGIPQSSNMHLGVMLRNSFANAFASLLAYTFTMRWENNSKPRFTIWRIAPSCRAASRPAAKIEIDSILAVRQRGMAPDGAMRHVVNLALHHHLDTDNETLVVQTPLNNGSDNYLLNVSQDKHMTIILCHMTT